MSLNIAKDGRKRIVIVGGGFGGLQVANRLKGTDYQVILIDKNNYHQFPPLIYQVASAGMEASSISFPFRRNFQKRKNFYFRMAELRAIFPEKKLIQTSIGWSTIIWCWRLAQPPISLAIRMLKSMPCP